MTEDLLSIRIFGRKKLSDSDLHRLLAHVQRRLSVLGAVKCGDSEPLQARYSTSSLPPHWQSVFLWEGRRPSATGYVQAGRGISSHTTLSMNAPGDQLTAEDVAQFLPEAAEELEADYACAHLVTKAEAAAAPFIQTERGRRMTVHIDPDGREAPTLGIYSWMLASGIPDLYWANFFGPPYERMFGRERLVGAPAEYIQASSAGMYLQLTRDYTDVAKKREEFLGIRARVKRHLGEPAFFSQDRSYAVVPPAFSRTVCLIDQLRQVVDGDAEPTRLARFVSDSLRLRPPVSSPFATGSNGGGEAAVLLWQLACELREKGALDGPEGNSSPAFWRSPEVVARLKETLAKISSLPPPPETRTSELKVT